LAIGTYGTYTVYNVDIIYLDIIDAKYKSYTFDPGTS